MIMVLAPHKNVKPQPRAKTAAATDEGAPEATDRSES